ncbi:DNA ligase D [Roseomonas terrae]|jgi:bifunctional non-homologous end joining protein LigD|uniref:DNA ligase (ATP) n=1 Tax=Neoroseomonas terrae TaxID=424799 RepID=A0ABS5EBA8_9PROT|nr:DNA ligase D [Neoroseomonas terrae]MBR0648301.1 DNA ligase D [Neoroseomonas terrae]
MALEAYRQKRDFAKTKEPRGKAATRKGSSFVIQKHDATRLHYDFRLEMDGVLKSWAVTKGPSLVAGEKRLAVHVEDHPLEYGEFEGTIPKGEYGGGTVIVWDRGQWTPIGDAKRAYAKGHLEFELEGAKLSGRWHLVKMRGKPGEKRENWLLIKGEDESARPPDAPDILEEAPVSVKTGRGITEVEHERPGWSSKTGKISKSRRKATAEGNGAAAHTIAASPKSVLTTAGPVKGGTKASLPAFVEPALATLVMAPPSGERWLHEIKFDGYRLQVRISGGRAKLLTRSGLDWTGRFGKALAAKLAALPVSTAIFDGELVVENGSGSSDFSLLQADLAERRSDRFALYLFDLLYLDGMDLRDVPLIDRKARLRDIIAGSGGDSLRFSEHFDEPGDLVMRHACRLSLEGIVSKERKAPYRSGRGKTWTKSKCSARQEFVIAGYVPSTISRRAIGSLVLGVHEKGGLRHVGRVGTGFTARVAEDLYRRLDKIRSSENPFADRLTTDELRQVRFVEPSVVAEVEFRAWTGDRHLRHASFRGIRDDKPAAEIVREGAEDSPTRPSTMTKVKLTHPDRIYWPQEGVTKEGLANYYSEVWRFIAPHIVGRPLALVRCPTGITGETFFQKHAWKGINSSIRQFSDPTAPDEEPFLGVDDIDGLIGLVQSATLEIHPWGSTTADWERPDRIIMDLDPGDGIEWPEVIDAALEVRQRLEQSGLSAFLKTSGGKGLHVVSPLTPDADWAAVKAFTKGLADVMATDKPERYVSTITKSKRRGKILIDYLRNQRGATAVAPYSPRARPGAGVSTPIDWAELSPEIGPAHFTVENIPKRLAALTADPWGDFRKAAAPLEPPAGARRRKR